VSGLLVMSQRLFDVGWMGLNGLCMVFIVSLRKAHSTLHP